MPADPPQHQQIWKAIQIYLQAAYDNGPSPAAQAVLAKLEACTGPLLECPAFARSGEGTGARYLLRLGNRGYPHMKLALEPDPHDEQYLFRVDTHDRHICPPPGSREHEAFRQLMLRNQQIADEIEEAWAAQGVPTFKSFLRDDLNRRQRAVEPPAEITAASDPTDARGIPR